jgi:hypothetical protein
MSKVFKFFFTRVEIFFLWSSGANLDVLSKTPTEKSKYFGIGGTIVFTALMASFAGGYAFFTAFKSVYLSVPFGIFWGMLIFNLDRYIVASFGVGDGKKTISKQEIIEAAPRLAMAIILGFVISTPLELKLFEKEINAEIDTKIALVQNSIIKSSTNDPQILSLTDERNQLTENVNNRNKIITDKLKEYNKAIREKNDELYGKGPTGKVGRGEYYDGLVIKAQNAQKNYNETNTEYSKLNTNEYKRIKEIDEIISKREKIIQKDVENQKTVQAQNDGLLARLTALNSLTSKEWTLSFAKWLITALFIFIEIAPILFKMMTERGPYDDIVDRIKHETMVRQLEIQSEINQEINSTLKISEQKAILKIDKEIKTYEELLNEVANVQKELSLISINQWRQEQLELIQNKSSTHNSV